MINERFNPLSVRCRRETPPSTGGTENHGHDSCLVNRLKCRFGHSMFSKRSQCAELITRNVPLLYCSECSDLFNVFTFTYAVTALQAAATASQVECSP